MTVLFSFPEFIFLMNTDGDLLNFKGTQENSGMEPKIVIKILKTLSRMLKM